MDPISALAVASLVARLLGGVAETTRNVKEIRDTKRELWGEVKKKVDDGLDEMNDRYNVQWAQDALNVLETANLKVDGWYGNQTRRRVAEYQGKSGLVPDGMLGPLTLAQMIIDLKKLEVKAKEAAKQPEIEV